MIAGSPEQTQTVPSRVLYPLYAAGFVTAFGAHSIAASLGAVTHQQHASLLTLVLLLAVDDGAEVVVKPVFGSLVDRVGSRPVLLGGLLACAGASGAFVLAGNPAAIRIYSGPKKPHDAFAAISYQGIWFWVDERDWQTKRAIERGQIVGNIGIVVRRDDGNGLAGAIVRHPIEAVGMNDLVGGIDRQQGARLQLLETQPASSGFGKDG